MRIKKTKLRKIIREEILTLAETTPFGGHLSQKALDQPHGEKPKPKKDPGPFADLKRKEMIRILNEFMEFRRLKKRKEEEFPDFDAHLAEKNIPHYSIKFKDKSKPYPPNFEIFLADNTNGEIYCMVFKGGITADYLKKNKRISSLFDTKVKGVNVNDSNLDEKEIAKTMLASLLHVVEYRG